MMIPTILKNWSSLRVCLTAVVLAFLLNAFTPIPEPRIRNTKITKLELLSKKELEPGVTYCTWKSNGTYKVIVHSIELDRNIAGSAIRVIKGKGHAAGREMLKDMSVRYELETSNAVLGVVNANFWAAVRNNPIGPCVIDGEVVEMLPYKQWSTAFFDIYNQVFIDTLEMYGHVVWNDQHFTVGSTNRRVDSTDLVLFNSFGGETVPFVTADQVEWLFNEALKDTAFTQDDSTELELSQELLKRELERAKRESSIEHPKTKVKLRYLRPPAVNRLTPCIVLGTDTGTVAVPIRGCILSFDEAHLAGFSPRRGDTVMLDFRTNIHTNNIFMNAVCGTPRLVRSDVARHEARDEGVRSRRFISHNLARTALGTDKNGDKLILAVVPSGSRGSRTIGASLDQMSQVMKLLGAHDAINLDGGGSTGMVVDNTHAFLESNPDTRPVSVGLAIVKLRHILRNHNSYNR